MTYDRRAIFTAAHAKRRECRAYSMAAALRHAWKVAKYEAAAERRAIAAAAEQAVRALEDYLALQAMPPADAERCAYLTDTRNFPISARGNVAFDAAFAEAQALKAQYRRAAI